MIVGVSDGEIVHAVGPHSNLVSLTGGHLTEQVGTGTVGLPLGLEVTVVVTQFDVDSQAHAGHVHLVHAATGLNWPSRRDGRVRGKSRYGQGQQARRGNQP